MKIVSWNCNGALRKKFDALLSLNADVYIVQECEDPAQANSNAYREWAANSFWVGGNKNKGLGVFSRHKTLARLEWPDNDLELFLPFTVGKLTMVGVWACHANSPTFGYIGQAWKYIQANHNQIPRKNAVVLGDFNSNTCWDKWDRWWNHSDVVRVLSGLGMESVYHFHRNEPQGKETQATFYMYRKRDKPYHIDHTFVSTDLLYSATITIGNADEWLVHSDHMPVILDVVES